MGINNTRILKHFGLNIEKMRGQEIQNQDNKIVKETFKYTNLLKIYGGSLTATENIDNYLNIRIEVLKRLQRANQNFKNRLIKQLKKQNEDNNGK